MKPRFVILAAVAVALVCATGHAAAQTLKKQIVGTWSVVSMVNEVDGKKVDVFGSNPQGQVIFTPDGYFSISVIRPGRLKFASNNRTAGTPEENKEAMAGCISEFGTYTINYDGSVTLHVIGSNFPNWDGADQKRSIQGTGNELKVTNRTSSTGSGVNVITLRRAK